MSGNTSTTTLTLNHHLASRIAATIDRGIESKLVGGFDFDRQVDLTPRDRGTAYGVACCVFGIIPETRLLGDRKAWAMVTRLVDTLCSHQAEDGSWGWGNRENDKVWRIHYSFSLPSLVKLLAQFGDEFEPDLRARFEKMIRRALAYHRDYGTQFLRDGSREIGLNILTAHMAALWLGGQLFNETPWMDTAKCFFQHLAQAQSADGFWPDDEDHTGPATLYNTITLRHLAEYAAASRDPTAIECIERAARFHDMFGYPDGTCVETFDERNRYRGQQQARTSLITAFAIFDTTRHVAEKYAGALADIEQTNDDFELTLLTVDAYRALASCNPIPKPTDRLANYNASAPTIPASVCRATPWQFIGSACTRHNHARRYHYDLQNHLSIWHDQLGLVLGGGNSLHDPYFSTFRFRGHYLADRGTTTADENSVRTTLAYGSITATFNITVLNDRSLQIDARATPATGKLPADSQFSLHFPQARGQTITWQTHRETLGPKTRFAMYDENIQSMQLGRCRVETDRPLHMDWPCMPIDIYNPPARAEQDAVFRVAVSLTEGPTRIRLTVE